MNRKIITTLDGSKTIQLTHWDEQYHSKHGAIQEAKHVFIKHGLQFCATSNHLKSKTLNILEIGFGTGLNAFLTYVEAQKLQLTINYIGVEAYPVLKEELQQLNYSDLILKGDAKVFETMHNLPWEAPENLASNFTLTKQQKFFKDIEDNAIYNLIYFDAFGARVQPELWTEAIFKIMYNALKPNGVLVTYSAKGSVRRAMQSVGFSVEKLQGPPGKREMLRAQKC